MTAADNTTDHAQELLDALILALPYVESAEHDPAYKAGAVSEVANQIRVVISKACGGSNV